MRLRAAVEAGIALGANLGDREANIRFGIERLCDGEDAALVALSSLHRTEPWGPIEQEWYLNAAALITTRLSPFELLARTQAIERAAGRRPGPRYGPRALDIDLLWVGDLAVATSELTLPHPGLLERAFVLLPLSEVAADRIVGGRRIGDAAAAIRP